MAWPNLVVHMAQSSPQPMRVLHLKILPCFARRGIHAKSTPTMTLRAEELSNFAIPLALRLRECSKACVLKTFSKETEYP
ncbi:hypothetical protein VNO77_42089 [Canavalia gladiata]|uniref:Uncharacterized protein n=1 Tax=Canavalia gladiata TaxID=3824 RepID=A0AAN9K2N1_CANGL